MFILLNKKIKNFRLIIGGKRGFAPILIIGARALAAPPESTPLVIIN